MKNIQGQDGLGQPEAAKAEVGTNAGQCSTFSILRVVEVNF